MDTNLLSLLNVLYGGGGGGGGGEVYGHCPIDKVNIINAPLVINVI